GPATVPAFRALRCLRRLRGTPWDLFGWAPMRRTERRLVDDYRRMVAQALDHLGEGRDDQVRQVAELPDLIRGYDEVKRGNIERFRAAAGDLAASLERSPEPSAVGAAEP